MNSLKAICHILRCLDKAMDYDEPDISCISSAALGISDNRQEAIMRMLREEHLIAGPDLTPRITLRGLEYLQQCRQ